MSFDKWYMITNIMVIRDRTEFEVLLCLLLRPSVFSYKCTEMKGRSVHSKNRLKLGPDHANFYQATAPCQPPTGFRLILVPTDSLCPLSKGTRFQGHTTNSMTSDTNRVTSVLGDSLKNLTDRRDNQLECTISLLDIEDSQYS
ncbi:hypothetical protein NPIL_357481 [Nephila pilipes]|uniref:Uncharacterized protein n=1 Tax=Nephila pilipes TaxID=299642 RepID=A0A8X6QH26_NEPPI|nr:hypothetical protein NPIL_357481 [Nephila pilipes]